MATREVHCRLCYAGSHDALLAAPQISLMQRWVSLHIPSSVSFLRLPIPIPYKQPIRLSLSFLAIRASVAFVSIALRSVSPPLWVELEPSLTNTRITTVAVHVRATACRSRSGMRELFLPVPLHPTLSQCGSLLSHFKLERACFNKSSLSDCIAWTAHPPKGRALLLSSFLASSPSL
jgi:hypothetical protein